MQRLAQPLLSHCTSLMMGEGPGGCYKRARARERKGVFVTLVNTAQDDLFAGEDKVFGSPKLVLCCPSCYCGGGSSSCCTACALRSEGRRVGLGCGNAAFYGLVRDRNEGETVGVETQGTLEKEITQIGR